MSDDLIRWAPLAIVLIGIGMMVWAAVVMRRQEKDALLRETMCAWSINVKDRNTLVFSYAGELTQEHVAAIQRMTGVYVDVIPKEARPTSDAKQMKLGDPITSDAADFGGMPG